ncbi:PAS-domain containing protein, partial [Escherichia coli]|uniref:PAS-domain containing protein n=4 Tax=Bacteria TaxID=2 RepID=UPI003D363964
MEPDLPLAWLEDGVRDAVSLRRYRSGKVVEVHRARMPDGGMVMSLGDITESLRAAERLRETNETLERRVEERTADIN